MRRRPPDFGGHTGTAVAKRFDRRREQQRLGDRGDLRPEALLRCLRPERGKGWGHEYAGDDLYVLRLEHRDLARKVVRHRRIEPGIDQREAFLLDCSREAALLVANGVAIRIVAPQAADHL